jgi:squalene synthase HpnC
MAQANSENFPVASHLLPRAIRPHLLALYGFARLVDDIGDESDGDRLSELDWAEQELDRAAAGEAQHPVFVPLSRTIGELDLPLQPFRDLIDANRMDQSVTRYADFDALVGYCMLSAAPVGRLVLAVLGCSTPERVAQSDRVCVGLQIAEHLQDVAEDAANGRVYLPLADLASCGCVVDRLLDPDQRSALRATVSLEVRRARALLADGAVLSRGLPLRARLAVAGFSAGGAAALDAIERASFDVIAQRCPPRTRRFLRRWLGTLLMPERAVAP